MPLEFTGSSFACHSILRGHTMFPQLPLDQSSSVFWSHSNCPSSSYSSHFATLTWWKVDTGHTGTYGLTFRFGVIWPSLAYVTGTTVELHYLDVEWYCIYFGGLHSLTIFSFLFIFLHFCEEKEGTPLPALWTIKFLLCLFPVFYTFTFPPSPNS